MAAYAYDVWGNVTAQTGSVDTPFGYAGQHGYVYDKETGLYFLKSRYYDPEIGRFTTKDRFMGFEEVPASHNPFTYCENDPVNKVDPDGDFAIVPIAIGIIAAFAALSYFVSNNISLSTTRGDTLYQPKAKSSNWLYVQVPIKAVELYVFAKGKNKPGKRNNVYNNDIGEKYGNDPKVLDQAYKNATGQEKRKIQQNQKYLRYRGSTQKK